jgi:hypothetical protein
MHEQGGSADATGSGESAALDDQRPPRKRIRVHRYVVTDERTGTTSISQDDGALDPGRSDEQTRYETVEGSGTDRFDEPRESSYDAQPRDLGGDGLRRRPE